MCIDPPLEPAPAVAADASADNPPANAVLRGASAAVDSSMARCVASSTPIPACAAAAKELVSIIIMLFEPPPSAEAPESDCRSVNLVRRAVRPLSSMPLKCSNSMVRAATTGSYMLLLCPAPALVEGGGSGPNAEDEEGNEEEDEDDAAVLVSSRGAAAAGAAAAAAAEDDDDA